MIGFTLGLVVLQEPVEILPVFTAAVQHLVENFFFSFASENPKSFLDNYNRFININKSYINRKKKKTANTLISTAMQTKITQAFSFLQKKIKTISCNSLC